MSSILKLIGGGIIGIGFLLGVFFGPEITDACYEFTAFWLVFLPSLVGSMVFFGLAAVLDGQAEIKARLHSIEVPLGRKIKEKKTCGSCHKEYDGDCTSCPYCGAKAE